MEITARSKTMLVIALLLAFICQVVEVSEWHIDSPQVTDDISIDNGSYTANADSPDNHCCQLHCHHVFIQDITTDSGYQKNSQRPVMVYTAYRDVRFSPLLRPPALI